MSRRRKGMRRAVAGIALAGGALAAIGWWNTEALRDRRASRAATAAMPAAMPTAANPAALASSESGGEPSAASPVGFESQPEPMSTAGASLTPPPTTLPSGAAASTQPAVPTGSAAVSPLLLHARQLQASGNLLDARRDLNAALLASTLSIADADHAKAQLRELNETLIFSPTVASGDAWAETVTLKSGDTLTKVSNASLVPHILLMRINHIDNDRKLRKGQTIKTLKGPFHAVVNKRAFTLDLYLGSPGGPDSMYITTFHVGLGASDSTPTGLWKCTQGNKLKNPTYHSPRGEGVIPGDDPRNPLGEYWIGLTGLEGGAVGKTSYGIHGTIEPDSIGKMSSMGCVRLANADVEQVFQMLFEGKSLVRVIE